MKNIRAYSPFGQHEHFERRKTQAQELKKRNLEKRKAFLKRKLKKKKVFR